MQTRLIAAALPRPCTVWTPTTALAPPVFNPAVYLSPSVHPSPAVHLAVARTIALASPLLAAVSSPPPPRCRLLVSPSSPLLPLTPAYERCRRPLPALAVATTSLSIPSLASQRAQRPPHEPIHSLPIFDAPPSLHRPSVLLMPTVHLPRVLLTPTRLFTRPPVSEYFTLPKVRGGLL
ncbi:hypothetical protein BKA70DRAFT_1434980 [Coprinopsis sp. MPI-PUGE-AT-0042]|nr:hypothetical protein BKA70DRAFT_1434980 [Coprinopsis sp. MPI-PUGE-AT-0042]